MLVACCLELVARTRCTLHFSRRFSSANDLILLIPGDSVKFWMSKNVCHVSVYRIPRFELLCPNIYDNLNISPFGPGLDMYERQSLL